MSNTSITERKRNIDAVNLKFTKITYQITDPVLKDTKLLLNGVSGEFVAGEFSGIIGPSGCGKTTLLNVLSGYRIHKTSGQIDVNDKPQDRTVFRKISRYVLQDDYILPHFTVLESLEFVSYLKLGNSYTKEQRLAFIKDHLKKLHLEEQSDTMISNLSGGERKRICIALELLNNPPVLFLDEPTTGLDEWSASECLIFLKNLALMGHTVICSIHAPSARLLAMFDSVYTMSKGQCIYQGQPDQMVTYLEHFSLMCPVTYNPADFIIEVATGVCGDYHDDMVHEIQNGKITKWFPISDIRKSKEPGSEKDVLHQRNIDFELKSYESNCSWCSEYKCLFQHFLISMWRDKIPIRLRSLVICMIAALIGFSFRGVGSNAKFALYNFHFSLLVTVFYFILFYAQMVAQVPIEIKFLRRQHFNQWYRLSSYFAAFLTSQVPYLILINLSTTYFMYVATDQPNEFFRYCLFLNMMVLISIMGLCYGVLLGSMFNQLNGLFLGTFLFAYCILAANYSTERTHLSILEQMLLYSSFIRHDLEGILAALLYFNRADFICPPTEIFCIMSKPEYILKLCGSLNVNYNRAVICVIGFCIIFLVLSFGILKLRLSGNVSLSKNRTYVHIKYVLQKNFALKTN